MCSLTSTNLVKLYWAVFSFNFNKLSINPTKIVSLLTQPKRNEPEPKYIDETLTLYKMFNPNIQISQQIKTFDQLSTAVAELGLAQPQLVCVYSQFWCKETVGKTR